MLDESEALRSPLNVVEPEDETCLLPVPVPLGQRLLGRAVQALDHEEPGESRRRRRHRGVADLDTGLFLASVARRRQRWRRCGFGHQKMK